MFPGKGLEVGLWRGKREPLLGASMNLLLPLPAKPKGMWECQENCSIRTFVKVALEERLPRDSWCRHGLLAQNDEEPGTPGVSRMRVDEHTGCSESPDTIPVRQGGFARSTGYTVATGPALSNADPQLLA